jgi:hypothetical protein
VPLAEETLGEFILAGLESKEKPEESEQYE